MCNRTRLIVAIGTLVLGAGLYGCQAGGGSLPTEADRSIETSATAQEINAMISALLPKGLANAASAQFKNVVRELPKKPAGARQKAQNLMDFILKHYVGGKWSDPGGAATGELIAAIAAYVGLLPEDADAATACVPNVDCDLFATEQEELALIEIPGPSISVPFVLVITKLPDDFADPPLFPQFFEFSTIPEGITFPSSPSGSLTLSQFDNGPLGAVCTLDDSDPLGTPAGAVPGENLFLAHQENGNWVQLPYVDVTNLDCSTASSGIGESAGLWSSPIDLAIGPMIELLSPASATAGGRGLGGAISSFSPFGGLFTGPIATTTTLSLLGETTTFYEGETILFHAVVEPAPDNEASGIVFFYGTTNPSGNAGTEVVIDGEATEDFLCGGDTPESVPFGSHEAQAQFNGTAGHAGSLSQTLAYECLEAPEE
jgi:hypothetical protein